jgi:hypothetical protein
MKAQVILTFLVIALSGCVVRNSPTTIAPWYPETNQQGDPIFSVFESRIPCGGNCSRLKFALVLYWNQETKAPTTFKMARVYVAEEPEGARIVTDGIWSITKGTKLDPNAVVYNLDFNAPEEFRAFWAIGDDILFVLDQNLSPRVGTAGYGYALNRTR